MMVDTTVPVIVLSRKRYTKVGQGDFWLKHRWSAMMADVITKNNNGRYKEEKKRNRRVSDPRVSTINGNQINGHVLVWYKILKNSIENLLRYLEILGHARWFDSRLWWMPVDGMPVCFFSFLLYLKYLAQKSEYIGFYLIEDGILS